VTTREVMDGINRSEITPKIIQLSFDENGNLKVATEVDSAGLAKEATVEAIKDQTDKLQFDSNNNLLVGVNADDVGLAKDATVKSSFLFLDHVGDYSIDVTNSGTAAAYISAFSSAITVDETAEYSLVLAINAATSVKLVVTSGINTYSYLLNHGNALAANAWYVFDGLPLLANDAINLEIDVAAGATVTGVLRLFRRR